MSKAIADKCDCGFLIAEVEPNDIEALGAYIKEYGTPTHVTDIYKMRSGTYKGKRIWSKINLGTGERKDLFITDESGNLCVMDSWDYVPALPGSPVWITKEFLDSIPVEEGES